MASKVELGDSDVCFRGDRFLEEGFRKTDFNLLRFLTFFFPFFFSIIAKFNCITICHLRDEMYLSEIHSFDPFARKNNQPERCNNSNVHNFSAGQNNIEVIV